MTWVFFCLFVFVFVFFVSKKPSESGGGKLNTLLHKSSENIDQDGQNQLIQNS